jgi:hypothetical protein
VNDSISFILLNDLLQVTIDYASSFLNSVQYTCNVAPFIDYLKLFSCACGESVDRNSSLTDLNCNGTSESDIIGGLWLCPDVDSVVCFVFKMDEKTKLVIFCNYCYERGFTLFYFYFLISIQTSIVSGQIIVRGQNVTGELCKYVRVLIAPDVVFVGNRTRYVVTQSNFVISLTLFRVPLTVLGNPNPINADPVRNFEGTSVGQVIGNGMSFILSNLTYGSTSGIVSQSSFSYFLFFIFLFFCQFSFVFNFLY